MSAIGTLGGFRFDFNTGAERAATSSRIDSPDASEYKAGIRLIKVGEVLTLPRRRYWTVVSGRLWLTHENDSRDAFPKAGARFESGERSVVQALEDSLLQLG